MSDVLRLLLVDDHDLFREGLAGLLAHEADLGVVGQAVNGQQALQRARELMPDVILMDVDMPVMNGLAATRAITAEMPYIKIVMLTVHEEEEILFEAIKSGAQGYLLKNIRTAEMLEMLRGVGAGEAPVSRLMASRLLREFSRQQTLVPPLSDEPLAPATPSPLDELTNREREVLELVAQRAANKEIALRLNISEYTVKNHLRNILAKLHLSSRNQAARMLTEGRGRGSGIRGQLPEASN